jgi:hypothetical protein
MKDQKQIQAEKVLLGQVRASPIYRQFIQLLRDKQTEVREVYEAQTANEHTRGKINQMTEIINLLEGKQ